MNNKKILTVTLNPAIDQTLFIPGFGAGEVNRVERSYFHAGGKGVNVASLLADYGFSISVTGFLGDSNTEIFEELFKRKIICDKFVRIPGTTRTGIKIVNKKNSETTDINFPGALPADEDINVLVDVIKEMANNAEWLILAGSLPPGLTGALYKIIIELAHSLKTKVAVDTSGKSLKDALIACPDLIKPNKEELEEITGKKLLSLQDVADTAKQLVKEGIETVIVSMGPEGAVFAESKQLLLALPGKVDLISTVGAGDAMLAGTIAGKLQNKSLEECAKLGTAFSMSALSRLTPDLPDENNLKRLFNQVDIRPIK